MSIYELTTTGGTALALRTRTELKLVDGSPMILRVHPVDTAEYMRDVPEAERDRLEAIWDCFRIMVSATNLKAGAMAAAMMHRHDGWGWSAKTLLDLFRAYKNGGHKPGDYRKIGPSYQAGDWRILVRSFKPRTNALPPEFARWLVEQWSQFRGRSDCVRALYTHVVKEIWLKGHPVPCFGTVDQWCQQTGRARPHPLLVRPGELPDGWSESTFRRALPKRRATREQVAGGYLPAHAHQPDQVLTDRSGLRPLEFIVMDDHRGDFRCLYFQGGRGEFVYPLIVASFDACSAVDTALVGKPRALKHPEAENTEERAVREGVSQDMALQNVINTIREFGFPDGYPITFVHEKAAACIPHAAKKILEQAFGDRIRFMATATFNAKMMTAGFSESGGQPYSKALAEVSWRILETHSARLPLATGPRYDSAPSENKAIEKYALSLIKGTTNLEQSLARLKMPALDFDQAFEAITNIFHTLRCRTNHKLQGFNRIREWRRNEKENYRPIEELYALPEAEQLQVTDIISRLECPAERFVRLARNIEFTAADENILIYVEGTKRPVTIRNGKIELREQSLGDDKLTFREVDHPLLDEEFEGKTFEGVLSRDGDRIVLAKDGRILGSIFRQELVCRSDIAALRKEQLRVRQARIADRTAFAAYALGDQNDALARLREHNAAVLANPSLPSGGVEYPVAIESTPRAKKAKSAIDHLLSNPERYSNINDEG